MANQKISQLTVATTVNAADQLLLTQSGSSVSVTPAILRTEYLEPNLDVDKIPFTSITGTITATNLGDAVREVQNELLAIDADNVSFSSVTGGLTASNVGDALRQLQDEIVGLDADNIAFTSTTGGITSTTVGNAIRELEDEIAVFYTGQTYTPTNVITTRSYDADTVTLAELADVVGTLIADLQQAGFIL